MSLKKKIKFATLALAILTLAILCTFLGFTDAAPEVAASMTVDAFVPSNVSDTNSEANLIGGEDAIQADGESKAVIVVTIKSKIAASTLGNQAITQTLQDIPVSLSSNRGAIDTIDPAKAVTKENGKVSFTVRTEASGQSTITALADDQVTLEDTVVINWKPLPIQVASTISVRTPAILKALFHNDKFTIFDSRDTSNTSKKSLINPEREFTIPFWIFGVLGIILIAFPILSGYTIYLFGKIKGYEKIETQFLAKEDDLLKNIVKRESK